MYTAEGVIGHLNGVQGGLDRAEQFRAGLESDFDEYTTRLNRIATTVGAAAGSLCGEMTRLRDDANVSAQQGVFVTNAYREAAGQVSVSGDGRPLMPARDNLAIAAGITENATVELVRLGDTLEESIAALQAVTARLKECVQAMGGQSENVKGTRGNLKAAHESIDARKAWLGAKGLR